ncbi:hypothetical protein GR925_30580 [Streptomyces sp. HUCO-GS316]|uniref:hypothetical protein n=1 Tax=Streptomyces sp. HUCO-GS316 TaxID=2692198 RepID=UPI0013687B00|nr:hypothetical protein [Streptomyces sp. HUCO-GS316]MXM67666.1 hypothetical protein [Streptomyces sp. HUCO-GS316]
MNRISTAVTRRTRRTALAVATAAVVTAAVWTASSGPTGSTSAPVSTSAVELADADADAVAFAGTDPQLVPGWLPPRLRADLRELRGMAPDKRTEAAARIWRDALAGEYGTRARIRAHEAQRRLRHLPEELRADIRELRGLTGEERREELLAIRDKALDGGYGDRVQRWAERRSSFWQQEHH